jgi:hypothetical protein
LRRSILGGFVALAHRVVDVALAAAQDVTAIV